jgi:hypothetical protein
MEARGAMREFNGANPALSPICQAPKHSQQPTIKAHDVPKPGDDSSQARLVGFVLDADIMSSKRR